MSRCLQLASIGLGQVAPNPLVGAVIVHEGKIIGEGYHQYFGGPHAEVNAIKSVSRANRHLLPESTLYVNLEPCAHKGKTPPCADMLINHRIQQVVIANEDPNPKVAGKGIKKIREAGYQVKTGVMANDALHLNRRYFTFLNNNRPYIILKWAQSKDGFISRKNEQTTISSKTSQRLVHKWRSEEQAILVGTNTALIDNPRLDARHWNGRNPLRVVIDKKLKFPADLHLLKDETKTIVFSDSMPSNSNLSCQYHVIPDEMDGIAYILQTLMNLQVQSLIIEGGSTLLQSFIDRHLWDEARILTGNCYLGTGVASPKIKGKAIGHHQLSADNLLILHPLAE